MTRHSQEKLLNAISPWLEKAIRVSGGISLNCPFCQSHPHVSLSHSTTCGRNATIFFNHKNPYGKYVFYCLNEGCSSRQWSTHKGGVYLERLVERISECTAHRQSTKSRKRMLSMKGRNTHAVSESRAVLPSDML